MTYRWRAVALSSMWMMVTLIPLQGVHILLPAISDDFDVSAGTAAWVAVVYTLANAGGFLAASHAGDLLGHKRVALTGSYIEVVILLLIITAPNLSLIIGLRFVQGVAHAMAVPNFNAFVVGNFEQEERGKVLGINAFVLGTATIFVALVVGAFNDAWGWRSAFLVTTVAVLIISLLMNLLLRTPDTTKRRPTSLKQLDLPGGALLMACVAPFLVGIQMAVQGQWGVWPYLMIVFAVALTVVFVRYESRQEYSTLPVQLLRKASFAVPNVYNLLFMFANGAGTYLLPVYFIIGLGWTSAYAGFVIIFFHLARPVASLISGFLSDRIGPRPLLIVGASTLTVATVGLGFGGPTGLFWAMVPFMLLSGFGQNLFGIANSKRMYAVVPREQLAMAPGTMGLGRHLSRTAGIGIAAGIFSGFTGGAGAGGEAEAAANAFRVIMFGTAGFIVVGLLLSWAVPALWRARQAPEVAVESGASPPSGG